MTLIAASSVGARRMLARTNLVILLLVIVAMISLFVGARFGLILALGLALGMTLEGLRFGFAGPWRAIILRREPAGFIAQLAAIGVVAIITSPFLASNSAELVGAYAPVGVAMGGGAFVFGLFHGFGFAGALGSIGLRNEDIPSALLFFNLGIEIGQILFILPCVAFFWILAKVSNKSVSNARTAVAYGLGSVAMFWVFERIPAIFSSPLVCLKLSKLSICMVGPPGLEPGTDGL